MLLASRSSDSIRRSSDLAAMAVMGSMHEGKGSARANRGLGYNFLKRQRISPKRRIRKPAVRGKSLPEMAWWAIFCRAARDQLLENAHGSVWPSSCNSRCVAALAVPSSLLAYPVRVSTPGASSRPTAEASPDAETTDAGGAPFPGLLAGMVAANGAAASDDHGTSSDGAPGHDTPAGSGTLLGRAAKKPSPTRKLAVGRAGPREQSEATAKLPMTGAQEPAPNQDPRRPAADQTTYGVKTQPAVRPIRIHGGSRRTKPLTGSRRSPPWLPLCP